MDFLFKIIFVNLFICNKAVMVFSMKIQRLDYNRSRYLSDFFN